METVCLTGVLVVLFRALKLWIGTLRVLNLKCLLKHFIRIKTYDNIFKQSLRRNYMKVIFITIKICRASYRIYCC